MTRTKIGRIKVLFVIPSLMTGGAEKQVVELVNGLDPENFEKHLFIFEENEDLLGNIDLEQTTYHRHVRRHKFDFSPAWQLAKVIDQHNIDVVHSSLQIAMLMAWLGAFKAKRRVKLLVAIHTTLNRSLKDERFDRYLYRPIMLSCSGIIFVCKAQEVYWTSKFPELKNRAHVVLNGIDTKQFDPSPLRHRRETFRARLNLRPDSILIANIAAFRPEKGHALLVDAFTSVCAKYSKVHLVMVGDGELRSKITKTVVSRQLDSSITFMGKIGDVREILVAADIVVIASTAETFSLAMLEAMAMEVPLIATDLGGTREAVIDGESGIVVPSCDANRLSASIITLIEDSTLRAQYAAAGRQRAVSFFDKSVMIQKTAEVITQCFAH